MEGGCRERGAVVKGGRANTGHAGWKGHAGDSLVSVEGSAEGGDFERVGFVDIITIFVFLSGIESQGKRGGDAWRGRRASVFCHRCRQRVGGITVGPVAVGRRLSQSRRNQKSQSEQDKEQNVIVCFHGVNVFRFSGTGCLQKGLFPGSSSRP